MSVNISKVIGNKRVVSISISGQEWRVVHKSLYRRHFRDILRCKTLQELNALFLVIEPLITKGYVYRLLRMRGYFTKELREKLEQKGVARAVLDQVLLDCQKRGYLDDQRETVLFAERGQKKGWGPVLIRQKLERKGGALSADLDSIFSVERQREMMTALVEKKYRRFDRSEVKVQQRIYRFLRAKGFDNCAIREFLFDD